MSIGSVLVAAGLAALAMTTAPWPICWSGPCLGLAMRLTLYDAAFAALVQVTPTRGRRAISYLTLFGGVASTVFWPIGYWLEARYGWRMTLMVFAAHQSRCLPAAALVRARSSRTTSGCRRATMRALRSRMARARRPRHAGAPWCCLALSWRQRVLLRRAGSPPHHSDRACRRLGRDGRHARLAQGRRANAVAPWRSCVWHIRCTPSRSAG